MRLGGNTVAPSVRLDGGSVVDGTLDLWWPTGFFWGGLAVNSRVVSGWWRRTHASGWQAGAGVRVGCRLSVTGVSTPFGRVSPLRRVIYHRNSALVVFTDSDLDLTVVLGWVRVP